MSENTLGTPKSSLSAPKKRRLSILRASDEIKVRVVENEKSVDKNDATDDNFKELNHTVDSELALKYTLLKESVKAKEEKLRKLKLVQTYRTRDKLENMDQLIEKWMKICQTAITDLHLQLTTNPKPTLTELIDHLKIDHKLIDYNAEEEDFLP